ncbi:Mannosylglycerate hydrolase [Phycisphaerae bacterium RAS1]|nr:Mannosylglycerate hydrolase [Phycisphaerae bacterium RAS1]
MSRIVLSGCLAVLFGSASFSDEPAARPAGKADQRSAQPPAAPPSTEEPERKLYVVATAHLDTQWLWTIQDTIEKFIPNTLRHNFARFEKYPNYIFNFEGAFRYMLAKEYYPEDYERLKGYIAAGRWRVAGSSVDAGDVNVVSPESLIRHVLYGNGFFKREFNKTSCDIFLPDCFGFGYALPTIAAHCGLIGFSTQKLTWGSAYGIPFDVGMWEGVDGSRVIAAVNPGAYVTELKGDLAHDKAELEKIVKLGDQSGVYVGYKYFGVGDQGGAPDEESVHWLEKSLASTGPVRVVHGGADQLYHDLTAEQKAKLPVYKGELLMRLHGTGCYCSQAIMKRWNRKNELLADAAERAATMAHCLGTASYPTETIRDNWVRFLWHHHHDDVTGTSIPQAYTFSWNDELISLNQFASVLTDSVGAIARTLDTRGEGVPLIVFNPLGIEREELVEAHVAFAAGRPGQAVVYGPDGQPLPTQLGYEEDGRSQVLFIAKLAPVSLTVFDLRPSQEPPLMLPTEAAATERTLRNRRYRVELNENGDVASIVDQALDRELLSAPIRMPIFNNTPEYWNEWEIRYEDISAEPREHVAGPARIRVIENGPIRGMIEVSRECGGSTYTQYISLAAGAAGHRVEVRNVVDWHTPSSLLKVAFPLSAKNAKATYDLGLGTIERGVNEKKLYEVPAQQWANLDDASGDFGVAILNDCKYGWDKPDDSTLRMTLVHTPKQVQKDMGRHEFTWAIFGHAGSWREGVAQQAARLNQPPIAFATDSHAGQSRVLSLLEVSTPQVAIRAVKKAEESDEIVVRLVEAQGKPADGVSLRFCTPIAAVREITGAEEPLGDAAVRDGKLSVAFRPYQPRAFALKLQKPAENRERPRCRPIKLAFDSDVISQHGEMDGGALPGAGFALPAEMLPQRLLKGASEFTLGPAAPGAKNAVACRGQTLDLGADAAGTLHLLAAAAAGDIDAEFVMPGRTEIRRIPGAGGFFGQWHSLLVNGEVTTAENAAPPYVSDGDLAWIGTHRHLPDGRCSSYEFAYLYDVALPIPAGAPSVMLPDEAGLYILAASVVDDSAMRTVAASELYDRFRAVHITPRGGVYMDAVTVAIRSTTPAADIRYTLDGSEPTAASPRYAEPLSIAKTTSLRAAVLRPVGEPLEVARGEYRFPAPRQPDPVDDLTPGLHCRYFEVQARSVRDFAETAPASEQDVVNIDLSPAARTENFALEFGGYLRIPRDGVYTLYLNSDDGSRLWIGDDLLVDHDGLHGNTTRTAQAALKAGPHRMRLTYFQRGGDAALGLSWSGPELSKQPVPAEALARSAGQSK